MPELLTAPPPEAPASLAPASWWERLGEWWVGRSRILQPEHSLGYKLVLSVFECCASLSLAVFLILSAAITQGIATFVEAAYGTPAAQFGVYQSWWFVALLVLLAINIFCAAAIRYPWKRYQTGFVVTHIGLLTLLGGTALSRTQGIDAQIQIFEGESGHTAQEDTLQFRLGIASRPGRASAAISPQELASAENAKEPVTFDPGPFNWADYDQMFAFTRENEPEAESSYDWGKRIPVRFSRWIAGGMFRQSRPQNYALERDGVRVEVLDYYSDSELVPIPSVDLRWGMSREVIDEATGRYVPGPIMFGGPVTLGVRNPRARAESFPYGVGEVFRDPQFTGGGGYAFWKTESPEQAAAFRLGVPEGPCGKRGQVVLVVDGKPIRFLVDEKLDRGPFALGDSGLTAEVGFCSAPTEGGIVENPVVALRIRDAAGKESQMHLWGDGPHISVHDQGRKIYGDYWYDRGDQLTPQQRMQGLAGTRFDILQTPDNKLLYRSWDGHKILSSGDLKPGGEKDAITAFQMPKVAVKLFVAEHRGGSRIDGGARPLPFSARKPQGRKRPAAKIRMTVDGESEEFWLAANLGEATKVPRLPYEQRMMTNKKTGKSVLLTMPLKSEPIGFRIRLDQFERKLDPGTSQAAHFSSTVDFLELENDRHVKKLAPGSYSPSKVEVEKLTAATSIAVHPKDGRVYWIDPVRGDIFSGSLTTREPPELVVSREIHGTHRPVALALDAEHDWLYWADPDAGGLGRASLAKKQVESLFILSPRPEFLALDIKGGHIYWADRKEKAIGRADLDGKNAAPRLIAGVEKPGGLAFDSGEKRVYWTDLADGGVRSAKFDGTERNLVYQPRDPAQSAGPLVCDEAAHTLYWLDPIAGALRKFAGSGEPETLVTGLKDARGLTLAGGHLWWTESAELRSDVWITMNAPVEFSNPKNHRSYRLFQESFGGPIKAGTPEFEEIVPPEIDKSEIYFSVLTVNYDPGRGIWQIGCLLIVTGIVIMFYMRAYFFMPGHRAEEAAA